MIILISDFAARPFDIIFICNLHCICFCLQRNSFTVFRCQKSACDDCILRSRRFTLLAHYYSLNGDCYFSTVNNFLALTSAYLFSFVFLDILCVGINGRNPEETASFIPFFSSSYNFGSQNFQSKVFWFFLSRLSSDFGPYFIFPYFLFIFVTITFSVTN